MSFLKCDVLCVTVAVMYTYCWQHIGLFIPACRKHMSDGLCVVWYYNGMKSAGNRNFLAPLPPNKTTIIIYEVYNCPKPHSVTSDYNSYNFIILMCLILVADTALES